MQAFRVTEVLTGHSSTAAIVGLDEAGREIRLEVGAVEAASVHAGEVLVVSWSTVIIPSAPAARPSYAGSPVDEEPVLGRSADDLEVFPGEAPSTEVDGASPGATEGEPELRGDDRVERELRALIGLV